MPSCPANPPNGERPDNKIAIQYIIFFFFSSRRRHTSYWRDWSSDVCSSDLGGARDGTVAVWAGVVGAVLGLHAGLLAFLTGAYPIVGGGLAGFVNTEIEPIRVGTHLGQAWTVTTFAWLGVLMLLVAAWVTPAKRERLLGWGGVLALGTAFGISWASHPAARGALALIADYLHLVAGALWVGGLLALAILAVGA